MAKAHVLQLLMRMEMTIRHRRVAARESSAKFTDTNDNMKIRDTMHACTIHGAILSAYLVNTRQNSHFMLGNRSHDQDRVHGHCALQTVQSVREPRQLDISTTSTWCPRSRRQSRFRMHDRNVTVAVIQKQARLVQGNIFAEFCARAI